MLAIRTCSLEVLKQFKGIRANFQTADGFSVVVCLFLTGWLVFATTRLELLYLSHYPFFYDPAAYHARDLALYKMLNESDVWTTFVYEFQNNFRYPLRSLPLLLVAPSQLASVVGHIWTESLFVWIFLSLLCSTVRASTNNFLFACSAVALFVSIPFLYDPVSGMAAFWLDFTSACALSSSAICLIRYLSSNRKAWLLAFGALASATALCRWSASVYLLVFASLAVPVALYTRKLGAAQLLERSATVLVTALPGLAFFGVHYRFNLYYYATFGFAFKAPVFQAISWTLNTIPLIMGVPQLAVLVLLSISAPLLSWRAGDFGIAKHFICLWLPTSIFSFLCFIVGAVGGVHPYVYFAPALFVAAFCGLNQNTVNRQWLNIAASLLVLLSIVGTGCAYNENRKMANGAPPLQKLTKERDQALAGLIELTRSKTFAQFDSETNSPQLELFFNHQQKLCDTVGLFSIHELYLRGLHPNQTPNQVADKIYADARRKVELIAVLSRSDALLSSKIFNNSYSATVAREVSLKVHASPEWKFISQVNGPVGQLDVYENTALKKSQSRKLTKSTSSE